MSFFQRFKRGELKLARIEAFSDGVFAIIVTLLVLELKVPALQDHHSVSELAHALLELAPKFLAWLISFIIVCKFWINHHHVLSLARHADYAMVWINAIFLMFQSFIPFPTALMGEYAGNPLAMSLFGVVMALNTFLFIRLHAYVIRHLLKPEMRDTVVTDIIGKSYLGIVCYLVGVAASWASVYLGFIVYALTPLLFIVPPSRGDAPTSAD